MDGKVEVPNVILIVMDAVRADHLSCYGHHRKTSPNIDKLAKEGVLFERAFSAAEWSYPSHASIFTGKYPSYHKTMGKDISLHEENMTIAEILGSIGYETIGISSNILLSPINGFSKGFQNYIVREDPHEIVSLIKGSVKDFIRTLIYGFDWYTHKNVETIKKVLKKRNQSRPFFLFCNFYNCHAEYDPPRPYKKRFCSSLSEPPLYGVKYISKKMLGHTGEKIRGSALDVQKLNLIASEYGHFAYVAGGIPVSEEEWEVIKSWYDGGISYLDYHIGELIRFLQHEGIFEDTFLIITSDHGDNFGEHGLAGHQFCLYDSLLHVPLIMVYPKVIPKGIRISSLVSTIDIFPTILDVLNIKGCHNDIQGKSLFPFEDRKVHDFICAECGESITSIPTNSVRFQQLRPKLKPYDKGFKCLRTELYKYIVSADQNEELYDIQKDPLEKVNIASKHPDKTKYFRQQLENTIDISFFGPKEFSEKEKEEVLNRLQALGYI